MLRISCSLIRALRQGSLLSGPEDRAVFTTRSGAENGFLSVPGEGDMREVCPEVSEATTLNTKPRSTGFLDRGPSR